MTHTPTPEQLQDFKDWYCKRNDVLQASFDEYDWLVMYEQHTAYANHVLMKQQFDSSYVQIGESITADFQENTWTFEMKDGYSTTVGKYAITPQDHLNDLLRKLAALQEIVDADKDWMAELQQQLTDARKEIEGLKEKYTTNIEDLELISNNYRVIDGNYVVNKHSIDNYIQCLKDNTPTA